MQGCKGCANWGRYHWYPTPIEAIEVIDAIEESVAKDSDNDDADFDPNKEEEGEMELCSLSDEKLEDRDVEQQQEEARELIVTGWIQGRARPVWRQISRSLREGNFSTAKLDASGRWQ